MKETLIKAISTYGVTMQKTVAMEEMAELIKAISKDLRGDGDLHNIAEEIADVKIMLEQLEIMYNNKAEVYAFQEAKILRLAERLNYE